MNTKHSSGNVVWTVVEVNSGVPNTVETFAEAKTARRRANYLRRAANPNDDVVAVFPSELRTSKKRRIS